MFVNNESTAGVGNDKPVSILSDHFILSCFLDVAVITPMICSSSACRDMENGNLSLYNQVMQEKLFYQQTLKESL